MLTQGGGLWPKADGTDGIVGLKGTLRLSSNGKWFLPIEADIGTGSKNWQWNAFLAAGYHFHWGDVTLGVRNLTYQRSGNVILQEVRLTGRLLGANPLVKAPSRRTHEVRRGAEERAEREELKEAREALFKQKC